MTVTVYPKDRLDGHGNLTVSINLLTIYAVWWGGEGELTKQMSKSAGYGPTIFWWGGEGFNKTKVQSAGN